LIIGADDDAAAKKEVEVERSRASYSYPKIPQISVCVKEEA
jgi:hypothetical protein